MIILSREGGRISDLGFLRRIGSCSTASHPLLPTKKGGWWTGERWWRFGGGDGLGVAVAVAATGGPVLGFLFVKL